MIFPRMRTILLYILFATALIIASASRLWMLPAHISLDVNEGWNAFHAALATSDNSLYPSPNALTGNNYPPLSFYIESVFSKAIGCDPVVSCRIISLLSLLASCILLFLLSRIISPKTSGAGLDPSSIAVAMFIFINVTLFRRYVALNDPQWMAESVMLLGLFIFFQNKLIKNNHLKAFTSAFIMLIAGFIKHNTIDIPLSITIYIAIYQKDIFLTWLFSSIILCTSFVAVCFEAYGGDFFTDVFLSARGFSIHRATIKTISIYTIFIPIVCSYFYLTKKKFMEVGPKHIFLVIFAVISLLLGFVQRGGSGVDINAHFEAAFAISIMAGIVIHRTRTGFEGRRHARFTILAVTTIPIAMAWPFSAYHSLMEIRKQPSLERKWAESIKELQAVNGNVACQMLTLCFWAGKPFVFDGFLYSQHLASTGDHRALDQALETGKIAAFQFDQKADNADRLRALIDHAYGQHSRFPLGILIRR